MNWQPPRIAAGFTDGQLRSNRPSARISQAVTAALKSCGKTRAEIAEAMSAELGQTISVSILDAYASEGKEQHKITLERYLALIEATGCHDLLGVVTERFDYAAIPSRYADIITLHLVRQHKAEMERYEATLMRRLGGEA